MMVNGTKEHTGTCLLNNYSDVENVQKRPHHIENQLSKKPEVCKAYEGTI